MPKPRYTSASGITRITSSVDARGPSPSELVCARTKYTAQFGGASARMRCSASRVSVHVRDTALPSITSGGIASIYRQADDVLPASQLVYRLVDLLRGADELHIEGAIGLVLVAAAGDDVQPPATQKGFDGCEPKNPPANPRPPHPRETGQEATPA